MELSIFAGDGAGGCAIFHWDICLMKFPLKSHIGYSLRKVWEDEVHPAKIHFYTTLYKWNLLGEKIAKSASLSLLKIKSLKIIKPQKKSTYNICNIAGMGYFKKLRLRFNMLNEHKFWHNLDSLTPLRASGQERFPGDSRGAESPLLKLLFIFGGISSPVLLYWLCFSKCIEPVYKMSCTAMKDIALLYGY